MKNSENTKGRVVPSKTESKTGKGSTGLQRVCIEYIHPDAHEVVLAGSFNEWDRFSTRLTCGKQGKWTVELELPPGQYEYLLVVDGQWVPDPSVEKSVPNPHGGRNSVLTVTAPAVGRKTKVKAKPKPMGGPATKTVSSAKR